MRAAHVDVVVAHARHNGDVTLVTVVTEAIAVLVTVFLLDGPSGEHLDLARHHHLERFATDGLLDAREARAIPPLVELTAESIGLELEKAQLACGEQAMPTRGLNMRDRAIDDRRL